MNKWNEQNRIEQEGQGTKYKYKWRVKATFPAKSKVQKTDIPLFLSFLFNSTKISISISGKALEWIFNKKIKIEKLNKITKL